MPLVVGNSGEAIALSYLLSKQTSVEPLVLKLYSNNITPAETDTAATYTEMSGFGYNSVTLTGANWTLTPGEPTVAAYPQVTWTFTGAAGNAYGYYLVRLTTGDLVYSERFSDGPYAMANSGDQIKVTPTIGAS